MEPELERIKNTAKEIIKQAASLDELEKIRVEYLGRKGVLSLILRKIKDLPEDKRAKIGSAANKLREELESDINERNSFLKKNFREGVLEKEWLDVTRPGIKQERGHLHPITIVERQAEEIFSSLGFSIAEGNEVETEYYNFNALNIPKDHPARDAWDTFWLKQPDNKKGKSGTDKLLLRTHTSPVQIHYMETHNPPIRIIAPGRVYRYEATDASHDIQFYQIEGLLVDKNISIASFKAIINEFFNRLFSQKIKTRLRPSYFPFVEPGFEVDISCINCKGRGCSVCKKTGWVEIMGAGMVHPNVFKAVGYNPKNIQGFAFGMGLDRIVLMKYKIPDIRLFHSGDLKFLKQF